MAESQFVQRLICEVYVGHWLYNSNPELLNKFWVHPSVQKKVKITVIKMESQLHIDSIVVR